MSNSHWEWINLAEDGATAEWAARRRAIVAGPYWSSPVGRRPRWTHGIFRVALTVFGVALALTHQRLGAASTASRKAADAEKHCQKAL